VNKFPVAPETVKALFDSLLIDFNRMRKDMKSPRPVNLFVMRLIPALCFIFCPLLLAQNNSATRKEAYRLLTVADALKNKEKNCAQAIEAYEKSLALQDFGRPSVYQSLAGCYAQAGQREKAFFRLDKMLAAGWLDAAELKKDADLKTLLESPRGKKFLVKAQKAKAAFLKEIAPETYGINDNPALRKIEAWSNDRSVSAEDFFRLATNFNEFPQPKKTGVFVKFINRFSEKINAPFYVYIPPGYDAAKPHPVLIYSAGGWFARNEFASDEAQEFIFENPVLPFVEKENLIEIFPSGANSVGTYQYEGIENIRQILAKTKRAFNVDDNRVYLMGFSDGGVGAFRTAVFMPTDFAAFYAVNGRPFAGNWFANMSNRPFYSLSATGDPVFEIETTRSYFDFARAVGADWTYREIAGADHYYLPFLEDYLPAIFSHLKSTSRRAFRPQLNWETAWSPIGKIDWLEISEIDTKRARAAWHKIYEYQKKSSTGIETVKTGDGTAAARARYHNNVFEIETSCVAKLTVNLHPTMIDFAQPVKIIVNGKEAFKQKVSFDKEFMAKVFAASADRTLVWANKILLEVEK
jgi:pimeloyl-ACP methyl ester carboxylesterase